MGATEIRSLSVSFVDGLPSHWDPSADAGGVFSEMFALARRVFHSGACSLPGVSIKYDKFVPAMWDAVRKGFVELDHAMFCAHGLRWGFDLGVRRDKLRGTRVFRNYPSALGGFCSRVCDAIDERVRADKTLDLGNLDDSLLG